MTTGMPTDVEQAAATIRQLWDVTPRAGIILGTGLGNAAEQIQAERVVP